MDILITIVIGGFVGWIASLLMKTDKQQGLLANIVIGIAGSFLGGWLALQLDLVATSGLGRWLVAIGGAVLLIWLLKLARVMR